jgi:small GTP-binding protein
MPANLPPQYYEAEKRFRSAKSPEEKIAVLEEMLAIMPKHKGTDHLKAELRSRIAKLSQMSSKKSGAHRASMAIEKEGAAQVVVIGPPNTGKSQLVASITNASPPVADYPFTTQEAMPGMMEFENIQIQLIDTPPMTAQSTDWWLRHMLIRADALLAVIDLTDNPSLRIEELIDLLAKSRIGIGETKAREEQDSLAITYPKKVLIVGNKLDSPEANNNFNTVRKKYEELFPVTAISARDGIGLEELKRRVFDMLEIIRVYTKAPGQKPEMDDPIILDKGSTLQDAAEDVHKDFAAKLKFARIWGSGKYDGVSVKRNHVLQDGDIIELHM